MWQVCVFYKHGIYVQIAKRFVRLGLRSQVSISVTYINPILFHSVQLRKPEGCTPMIKGFEHFKWYRNIPLKM